MNLLKNIKIVTTKKNLFFNSTSLICLCDFNSSSTNLNNSNPNKLHRFVPSSQILEDEDFQKINHFVLKSKKLFILSGAGLSTESGLSFALIFFIIIFIIISIILKAYPITDQKRDSILQPA